MLPAEHPSAACKMQWVSAVPLLSAENSFASLPEEAPRTTDLVRVRDWLPDIQIDLRYAAEENFTGQRIYNFSDAWLRYGTVQKLASVMRRLEPQGFSLLIWDAFRPAEAQFRLWEAYPDPVYVADPSRGHSSHSRGGTVDLTLVTREGRPVEMPTDFDDFSSLADRDYCDVPETAAANARLLEETMAACGFLPYTGEWWHFSDQDVYPVEKNFIPPADPGYAQS